MKHGQRVKPDVAMLNELLHDRPDLTQEELAARAKLSAKLKQAVGRKFDAEVVIRDYRLLQFEQRIKTLRDELKSRVSDREELVWEEYSLWLDRARQEPSPAPKTPPGGAGKGPRRE